MTRLERPFSYVVQYTGFSSLDEIWDLGGKVVATVTRRPLREATDSTSAAARAERDSTRRAIAWLPDGSGLSWIENVPKVAGDSAESSSARRERVVQWLAPFRAGDTKVAFTSEGTIGDAAFSRGRQDRLHRPHQGRRRRDHRRARRRHRRLDPENHRQASELVAADSW